MKSVYIAKDGDSLDMICFKAYESLDKEIWSDFIRENEHLATKRLVAGDIVNLPQIKKQEKSEKKYLWQ